MDKQDLSRQAEDYRRIEKAIQFIDENFQSRPSLDRIAQSVHLSKFHFERVFKRWAGISPIQFMQYLTLNYSKQQLAQSKSLLETALDAGLSGPGRLHDLFVNFEAMTPGEFKKQGTGLEINYGFSGSPFGICLLAFTRRGICHLGFVGEGGQTDALDELFKAWPGAAFAAHPEKVRKLVGRIFSKDRQAVNDPFNLHVKGTNFQVNVWKALLTIPEGWVMSYQDVADYMGRPRAVRAVANAVAVNPVAYLIPCHRVIAGTGNIHGYRWGTVRKKAMVGWEAVRAAY